MASQPTRSALLLATIFLLGISSVYVVQINANDLTISDSGGGGADINDDSDFGGEFIGPKFGDRISPRHRPFVVDSVEQSSYVRTRASRSEAISSLGNKINSNSSSFSNSVKTNLSSNDNKTTKFNVNSYPLVTVTQSDVVDVHFAASDKTNSIGLSRKSDENDEDDVVIDNNGLLPMVLTNIELPVISDNQLQSGDGNTSSAQAHRLEMSTEFFVVPSTASSITRSTTIRPGGVVLAAKTTINPSLTNRVSAATPPTIISTHNPTGLRKEPWVVPVLVLASLAMIMMAAFEIFVLCKAWRTSPSRRHLFLGQMLLLGLFACAGLAAVLTATPTLLSCATVRFGAGVAFALVFASLLVKCVFLISLNGGVYLPAPYQGLLLLFAVLIQVAVGAQWLLTSPPAVDNVPVASRSATSLTNRYPLLLTAQDLSSTVPLCKTPFPELLFSLVYVVFLILFVAVLAIKSRGIRDNYREATYIGLAIGGSIPIWLGWTLCGLAVADRHKDACLAFGLVATSTTVFLVMFMPKGRQLAAMGKEGLYVEDREEQFSSLSRAGSGYSPSFFHFKPIKYGVMGPAPTSTTNTGNGTSTKHQAVATLGGGMY